MISLVVALTHNNVIGRGGEMPWHLKGDLKNFQKLTLGKPVVMGRKTFESIGKPLPQRRNVVLSRSNTLVIEGCECVTTVDEVLSLLQDEPEMMIIGGAEIYRLFMHEAERIYLTRIDCECEGDAFFPDVDFSDWKAVSCEHQHADVDNDYSFDMITLERAKVLS